MMQQSPSTVDTGDHFVLNSLRERPTAFHAAPKVGRKIQYGNPEPFNVQELIACSLCHPLLNRQQIHVKHGLL
jgi:hypothetical protein